MTTRKPARAKDQQGWLLSSEPDGGASAAVPPAGVHPDDRAVVRLDRQVKHLTALRADLRLAVSRAIAFLEAEQFESAKSVLIEAREWDQKEGSGG